MVSERLGHANAAFTMNVYQHVLPGMQAADVRGGVGSVGEPGAALGAASRSAEDLAPVPSSTAPR